MPLKPNQLDIKSEQVAQVALKTFFNIMFEWNVTEAHQIAFLGNPRPETFKDLQHNQASSLSTDTLERISCFITIYKNLGLLFPKRDQANQWIHKPNTVFGGASALSFLSSGYLNQLHEVCIYLNSQLK
ncbi:antitoxin Xre/MbcA/ParS toxin-binding domain-containing protein [Pseudoalteromonas sp. SR43-5]|uniref:antitoxin Xre/MbcA/ParS toxin-binding domain-containing protein n=1 Tax=Pseudoalteromonas sp. SR43-5 TaxID=2760941 RepID=UPI0015FE6B93|nr:antitoxin Xre/MbcA/ParS toxin-binding domain-containing protein [Pseudoalteromonas sp. SR43-5]MBB1307774.1 DUF2384 domain-containing protein [Pseudoalteromonas sp. SR43-5]